MFNYVKKSRASTIKRPRGRKSMPAKKQEELRELHASRTLYLPPEYRYFYDCAGILHYLQLTEEQLRKHLTALEYFRHLEIAGSAKVAANGSGNGKTPNAKQNARIKKEWRAFLERVWKNEPIDWAGEIAGHKRGLIRQGNERVLILKGPSLIEPKKGSCPFTWTLCEQLLGEAFPYVLAGFQLDRQALDEQRHRFGYVIMLTGPSDIGKSCFQHGIMTPWYGGRSADAFKYLSGKSGFNKALMSSEHLFLDDHSFSGTNQRYLEEAIKRVASKSTEEMEAKGFDAITVRPLIRRLSISINDEPHNLAGMPAIRADTEHKFMLITCQPAKIIANMSEAGITAKLTKELPAFVYRVMHEFKIPKALLNADTPAARRAIKRFGYKNYINPIFREKLNRESSAENLRHLVHAAVGKGNTQSAYPAMMHAELTSHPLYGVAIKKIAGSVNYFGTLIKELAESYSEEFQLKTTRQGRKYSIITPGDFNVD